MRAPCGLSAFAVFLFCSLLSTSAVAQVPVPGPIDQGRRLARDGRRAEALSLLDPFLAASPQDNDARTLRATILSWEGRYDEARKDLALVLAATPNHADALLNRGIALLELGQSQEAQASFERALAFPPGPDGKPLSRTTVLNLLARHEDAIAMGYYRFNQRFHISR